MEILADNEQFSDEVADSMLAEFIGLDAVSFHPSTDWNDCGSLVERFGVMVQPAYMEDGELWWISGCPMPTADEDTPQRAITRAALSLALSNHLGNLQ